MTQQLMLELFPSPPSAACPDANARPGAEAEQLDNAEPTAVTAEASDDADNLVLPRLCAPLNADPMGTLQDALDRLKCHQDVAPRRRRDLISAVRTVARVLGRPPELIAANLAQLRKSLAAAGPAPVHMSKKRLANVKSDAVFALKLVGTAQPRHRRGVALTAEWQALASRMSPALQWSLSRFLHWCSDNSVAPEMADASALDRLIAEIDSSSLVINPEKLRRQIVKAWAKCGRTVPG